MDTQALEEHTAVDRTALVAQLDGIRENLTGRTVRGIRVTLDRAWNRLLALESRDALLTLEVVESALSDLDEASSIGLRAEIGVFRAVGFALRDDYVAALPHALPGLDSTAAPDLAFVAAMLCRLAYWKSGDLERFHQLRREQRPPLQGRAASVVAFDRGLEAAVELQQLRFGLAGRLAQDASTLLSGRVSRGLPAGLLPTAILSELLYEQGALTEAERRVRDGLPLVAACATPETAVRVYPLLARIAAHRRQGELASYLLDEGEALGAKQGWPRLTAACLQQHVELLVRGGRVEAARECLAGIQSLLGGVDRSHYSGAAVYRHFHLARACLELTGKPSLEIVSTLRRLHREAVAGGDLYLAVQLAIRLSEVLEAGGARGAAVETVARSLELGAGVGLYQSFVDGGPAIGRLLALAAQSGRESLQPYAGSLLRGWRGAQESVALKPPKLGGPLSSRECGILDLIRRGYSNKRVAQELRIAPETVKSHAKHIFAKLGTQTRVEAVARAASLGLI